MFKLGDLVQHIFEGSEVFLVMEHNENYYKIRHITGQLDGLSYYSTLDNGFYRKVGSILNRGNYGRKETL